ncbi:UPF0389 protein FAM162A [Cricetulus griseus]|uniref:Protein FAM162A n=1 Tax=Cricetulus griseus TaxID=10029 RepID=G3IMZ7_CRIGR|nr:UPF0389 protein FAM162A [Cricetulus griseus]
MGVNAEEMCEAKEWIERLLTSEEHHVIENKHILYLGKNEHDKLSQLQTASGVSISETVSPLKAMLEIRGAQADLIEAVMNVECMLCEVQREVARKKEKSLFDLLESYRHRVPLHKPTDFEKKILLWSGRFKKEEEIPETISFEMLDAAKNKIRVKVSYLMIALTVAGCIYMVIEGKKLEPGKESPSERGGSYEGQNRVEVFVLDLENLGVRLL